MMFHGNSVCTCLNFAYYLRGNTQNFMDYKGSNNIIALLGQWKLGGYDGLGIQLGVGDRYTCKFVWKSLETCLLGRLRRCEDNIRKDVREMDCEDWR
jgi:hypothetical protein